MDRSSVNISRNEERAVRVHAWVSAVGPNLGRALCPMEMEDHLKTDSNDENANLRPISHFR